MFPIIMFMTFEDPKDESKFEDLINNYWDTLIRSASKILNNEKDAEDAVQNAFIKLYSNFEKYKAYDDESLVSLLFVMSKNSAIDIYRKNSRFGTYSESDENNYIAISHSSEEENGCLIDAMAKISSRDRDILMLRFYYEFGIDEIAKQFGISTGGVYKRIERAKEKLKTAIKEVENER